MNDEEAIVQALISRCFLLLEASGRHVHLTQDDAMQLFGHGLTEKRPLSQPGQFLCQERLTLVGLKGTMENVAVLGPVRKESQVEISATDARSLGISAPVRLSGDIASTPGIILRGPNGSVELPQGVIVAKRHIHMTPEDAARHGLKSGDSVRVRCFTERPITLEQVPVRVSDKFSTVLHMDYDEANACGFQPGDLGLIEHG